MELKCEWCKKEFRRQESLVKGRKHHFCSIDCYLDWWKDYTLKKKLEKAKVLKDGEMITSEFAKALGVSKTHALDILKELEEKGIVEKKWFGQWVWRLKK
jgi:DNA-binding MarR family transcriptional regulator